jgi:hypothetical protein
LVGPVLQALRSSKNTTTVTIRKSVTATVRRPQRIWVISKFPSPVDKNQTWRFELVTD